MPPANAGCQLAGRTAPVAAGIKPDRPEDAGAVRLTPLDHAPADGPNSLRTAAQDGVSVSRWVVAASTADGVKGNGYVVPSRHESSWST